MFSDYRGIPSQAKLLIYLSFIPNVLIGFIYSDLSYFLPEIQHVSNWGAAIGAMGVTLVALSIPFGLVADRYGRLKMLVLGNICASLSLIGFALTSNFALIMLVAVLEGTGEAAYAVSFAALIAEKAGDERRTSAFSLLAFTGWIAGALGNYIIVTVPALQAYGYSFGQAHILLYEIVAILSLAVTPFLFLVKDSSVRRKGKGILPHKSLGVIGKFGTYSVLIALGAGLFVPIMAYWFKAAYGVTDVVSLNFLGATYILTAFVVFVSPRLAKMLGLVKATVVTQASSTIFMLAVPLSPTFTISASFYLVRTFLMNLSNPLTQSLIMGLVSPDERGMASGITASLWRLPNSLSVYAGSSLLVAGYLALPFYIATALYVAGITLFWFVFRDTKLPEETSKSPQDLAQSSSLAGPEVER